MNWLNYHQLMNFWMVVKEGSVQQASQALHVTPASVSIQVRQLEKSLGVKLLRKQGRGVEATEVGRLVAEYADEIFSKGRELQQWVKGQPTGRPLELRVGIREVMPKLVAFHLLKPALEMQQEVRLICREGDMSELITDLALHKLDVVLTDSPLDPLFKIQAFSHRLGGSDVVIVGPPNLASQYRRGFPGSLDGAPMLVPTNTNLLRRQLDRWFNDLKIQPRICAEFDDSAMMKIAGRGGVGLLAVPGMIETEIRELYGLVQVGVAQGIEEQFYAVSIDRKIKHAGVLAICNPVHLSKNES